MAYGIILLNLRTTLALIFTSEVHSSWFHLYMNHISKISVVPFVVHADHRITCQQAINQSLIIDLVSRCKQKLRIYAVPPWCFSSDLFSVSACHFRHLNDPSPGDATAYPDRGKASWGYCSLLTTEILCTNNVLSFLRKQLSSLKPNTLRQKD